MTGEGGSGGALALGVGDRVLMLENAYYSVISPEGCATILFKDAGRGAARRRGAAHDRAADLLRARRSWTRSSPSPRAGPHTDPAPPRPPT